MRDGSFLPLNAPVPLFPVINSEDNPDALLLSILDDTGTLVQGKSFSEVELEDFFNASAYDLLLTIPPGFYRMEIELTENSVRLFSESIRFFYFDDTLTIHGIQSYPSQISPDSTAILQALVEDGGTNPFLRWSIDGDLFAEGYLSDGYDQLEWLSPEDPGFSSIRLEVFPFWSNSADMTGLSSSMFQTSGLPITNNITPSLNEFFPEVSYYSLFHFRGNLRDSIDPERATFDKIGFPEVALYQGYFGYRLESNEGLRLDESLIPFYDGLRIPFSINLSAYIDDPGEDFSSLQIMSMEEGDFLMQLQMMDDAFLELTGEYGSESFYLVSADPISFDQLNHITLSFYPVENGYICLLFLNGEASQEGSLIGEEIYFPSDVELTLSGQNGFTGLLDEWGLYYRTEDGVFSTDTDVFYRSMVNQYNRRLLFAEGFDGIYLSGALEVDSPERSELVRGALNLGKENRLTIEPFYSAEDFVIEIESEIEDEHILELWGESSEVPFLKLYGTGVIEFNDGTYEVFPELSDMKPLRLSFRRDEWGVSFLPPSVDYEKLLIPADDELIGFSLQLVNPEDSGNDWSIDSILIKKETVVEE